MKVPRWITVGAFILSALCLPPSARCEFERIVIDADFPAGYQVEVADVNGDGKPDIVALGGSTCAWYENPTWKKRIITGSDATPGIISSATADLDGDGKAEVAVAYDFEMNEPKRGKLGLAIQGKGPDDPWTFKPIADVPSIHRIRWGYIDSDKQLDLVVAPIFGADAKPPAFQQDPARLKVFLTGADPRAGQWTSHPLSGRPVLHTIEVQPDPLFATILTADNTGVGLRRVTGMLSSGTELTLLTESASLVPGAAGEPPKRGCSEVHLGRLKDGRRFLATIEPWHGSDVVVYLGSAPDRMEFGPRTVIDDTLAEGHALWVADIDGDGDDEVFAGHRGKDHRVAMYDLDGQTWKRTILDTDIAAQDLRGGDLDGDGVPDVVAIGGQTHNVVWYRPRRASR
jgi:hypothetical protein